jgi:DNA-directed RNA polymerase subunit RPC12/RpoP
VAEAVVAVQFHCGKCGKLIRAPREAAGQRGKCPYCQQSVYIPTPEDELEEIPLAPDESEGPTADPLDDEAQSLLSELGHAQDEPTERPGGGPRGAGSAVDVQRAVVKAVLLMKESRLEEAEELIRRLKEHAEEVRARVQALLVDEIPPPELEDCPPPLYKGFLRKIVESL